MNKSDKIFVAGASGMAGSAIIRNLVKKVYTNLVGSYHSKTLPEQKDLPLKQVQIDLQHQESVSQFFKKEEHLLTGLLEPTNEPYAIAKISGIKMCEAYNRQYQTRFLAVMPTNLYGPNDNFSLETSHVLPALIRKFHEARISHAEKVVIWGTGSPRREFLHVDDMADGVQKTYDWFTDKNEGH